MKYLIVSLIYLISNQLSFASIDTAGVSRLLSNNDTASLDTIALRSQSLYFTNPSVSMELSLKGLEIAQEANDTNMIARFLNIQAGIYRLIGSYEKAMKLIVQSNQIYKTRGDSLRYALGLINILGIFWDYYDDIEVHEYGGNPLQKVLENITLVERLAPHTTVSGYYHNLAGLYQSQSNFIKARHFGRKALAEARLSKDPAYMADAWAILGLVAGSEFKRDSIENYALDSSEHYCEKAGYVIGKITNHNNLADFYFINNELELAEKYWLTALRLCEQNAHFEDWLNEVYMNLAKLYDATEDYTKAFSYQTKYLELEKKKYQVQSNNLIAVNEAQRRKLAMTAELAQTEAAKKRMELENIRLENKIAYGILIFTFFLFIVLTFFFYPKIKNYKYLTLNNAVNDRYRKATRQGNVQIAKELDVVGNMITDRLEKRVDEAPKYPFIAQHFRQIDDYTQPYIFVSYSTKDGQTTIEQCKKLLDKEGFRTKIDVDDFEPGTELEDAVNKHLEGATHVLVMLSKHSLSSSWVATEVFKLSTREDKKVLVCDLDGSIHEEHIETELKHAAIDKLQTIEKHMKEGLAKGESLSLLSSERDKWQEYMTQLPANIVKLRKHLMINLREENFDHGMEKLVAELHKNQSPINP